jgi:hypothetical protein
VSVTDLLRDVGTDALCEVIREQERLAPIAKFRTLEDAHQFWRARGRLDTTICASVDNNWPWEVRPKSDVEREQDAYWRERSL